MVIELSKFIDWPETGFEEIQWRCRRGRLLARRESILDHDFRVARHPSGNVFGLDAAGGRAHFLSSAGQFVSKVMEVDLVWSAVWTTNCLPLGLTS